MSVELIQKGLDSIESKIGLIDAKHSEKAAELQDEILQLKQRGALQAGDTIGPRVSMSDQVLKALEDNGDLLAKTRSLSFSVKAAGDPVTTAQGRNIQSGGVGVVSGMPYGIQAGLRRVPAPNVTALEYHRFAAVEGAAGVQAGEGAAKPALRPTHSAIVQSGLTIAGYTVMSRQALNDSNELRQAVDITLQRQIEIAMDSALNAGNVSPAWDGLLTLATATTSLIYTDLWDAASEAASAMMAAGFRPDVIGISPADWLAIVVAKNPTTADYYSGSYIAPLPETLRGMRVVLSPTVTAGKCLVLDSGQIEVRVSEEMDVQVGFVDDQFTKNLVTVLAETRIIPVFRSVGAAQLVTKKAA